MEHPNRACQSDDLSRVVDPSILSLDNASAAPLNVSRLESDRRRSTVQTLGVCAGLPATASFFSGPSSWTSQRARTDGSPKFRGSSARFLGRGDLLYAG
jgi:hypothetical protein